MNKETKLLPCPFCGRKVSWARRCSEGMIWKVGDYIYFVTCTKCRFVMRRKSLGWLIRAWNRRTK